MAELVTTGRLCSDPEFGKGRLEACLKSDGNLLRFENITVQFSVSRNRGSKEILDQDSIANNLSLVDANGDIVPIKLYWDDDRTVLIDPDVPLDQYASYQIVMKSDAGDPERPHSSRLRAANPFAASIKTKPSFAMSHEVNFIPLNQERGVVLDQSTYSELSLVSTITNHELAESIDIRRIGSNEKYRVCDAPCPAKLSVALTSIEAIAPEAGATPTVLGQGWILN